MKTILNKDIVVILTNKGYVAIIDGTSLLFWKQTSPDLILSEITKKFPRYSIHLLNNKVVDFGEEDFVAELFLSGLPPVEVHFILDNVKPNLRIGNLRYRTNRPNSDWISINVSISRLLMYRIRNKIYSGLPMGSSFVGTEFKSSLQSKKYGENPYRLVEFIPGEQTDIPHNFRLELVFETFAEKVERRDKNNNIVIHYVPRILKPEDYCRYESHTVEKRLSECREGLVIAK